VVALSVIALIPTAVLLARLGLLTDPMVLGSFVLVLGFLAVGLVTTVRRVGNPIGWLLLWQGVAAGFSLFGAAYGMYDLQVAAEPLPGGSLLLWTSTWIWLAALAVSPVIHVLFPDGRLLSRRWAGVIWLALASMVLAMAAIAVAAWSLPGPVLLEGPSWGPELEPPPPLALVGLALFGVAEAASLTAMAIRLRRAKGDEREQIKWFLYAGSFVILGITVEVVLGVPITIASWLGGMVVPFAIAVALFKYRLYDIDRLINRTLVYGLLTALLGSIYAAAVLVLGHVFGGVAQQSPELGGSRRHPGGGHPVPTGPTPHSTGGGSPLQPPPLRRCQDDRGLQHPPARPDRPQHPLNRAPRDRSPNHGADSGLALASTLRTRSIRHTPP